MTSTTFFFDTYALFEIIRGNLKYARYQEAVVVTTIFNLAELNYGLKKETNQYRANELTSKFSSAVVEVTVEDVEEAMSLKIKNKDLSIPDAIGYTVAKRLQILFLTGDEDFKEMLGVEFVKK